MSLSFLNRILMARFLKQSLPKLAQNEQTIVNCSNSKQSLPKLNQNEQIIVNCSNSIIEMHRRVVLRRENVPRGPEVVRRWSKLIVRTL